MLLGRRNQTKNLSRPVKHGKTILRDVGMNPYSYLMLLPAFIYTFLFGYATLPYLLIAFKNFDYRKGLFGSAWVGLKNFKFFFTSQDAITVTWNTIKLNFLAIIIVTMLAILLTILLNETKNKLFAKAAQSTFVLPTFISWVAVSYFTYNLFSANYGFVNNTLVSLGIKPVSWYNLPGPWTWIITGIRIWKDTGIKAVIFLAAVGGIDTQLYEAAVMDGATGWQKNRYITIPLLLPTAAILTLLSLGKLFYGDFAMMYSIVGDNGLLFPTTDVIDTYVFRALRKLGDPSSAMAVGLFQAMIGFLLVYFSNRVTKRYFEEGSIF
jgi:putative aldouronate transport system permease protein